METDVDELPEPLSWPKCLANWVAPKLRSGQKLPWRPQGFEGNSLLSAHAVFVQLRYCWESTCHKASTSFEQEARKPQTTAYAEGDSDRLRRFAPWRLGKPEGTD